MKNIIFASCIAIASVGLVACSSNASPSPTVTVTQNIPAPLQDDPATPNAAPSNEELYLISLRSMENPIIGVATDDELLGMGYSVCGALDSGFTTQDVIEYMAEEMASSGMTSDIEIEAVGYIIGAAEMALCPTSSF